MRKGKQETYLNRCDNYETTKDVFNVLFKYIKVESDKKVWLPFYCNGLIDTYEFDFKPIFTKTDFFETNVEYDYLIDNCPYSIKQKVFERCVDLGKPFVLIVPIDTLERGYISKLLKEKDLTVIIPNTRFKFIHTGSTVTMPFKTCFFCVGFGLNKQIIFD